MSAAPMFTAFAPEAMPTHPEPHLPTWLADAIEAAGEGWFFCHTGGAEGHDFIEIQNDQEAGILPTDQAAWEHVIRAAYDGSVMHITALCWAQAHLPWEWEQIKRHALADIGLSNKLAVALYSLPRCPY